MSPSESYPEADFQELHVSSSTPLNAPPLVVDLARSIVYKVASREWPDDTHLVTQQLASMFNVSRSPVQAALALLAELRIVSQERNRGFFVSAKPKDLAKALDLLTESPRPTDDYLRIAADRLADRLPESIKEADLAKAYGLNRPQLNAVLHRMAQEGWIERKPGYGWKFLPILTSTEAYRYSYRFRMSIEPAALLEPSFSLSPVVLARLRTQQLDLLNGRLGNLTSVELFEIGSGFHEAVVEGAGNPFFLDALRRVNRLRRLIEYKAMSDTSKFEEQCREHLALLDMIENGQNAAAADFLRRHLDIVHAVKKLALAGRDAENSTFLGVPHF
jgi:DNA-binding GntR family transcriptional regulator